MYVVAVAEGMRKISYAGYRFPPEVIHQAIWLYLRFTLSFRDVEDLLAERGIAVWYETVRRWVNHFGPMIAAHLRKRRPKPHATWHLDEVYLKIDGRMVYLWRAVDAEGEVLDVQEMRYVQWSAEHSIKWLTARILKHQRNAVVVARQGDWSRRPISVKCGFERIFVFKSRDTVECRFFRGSKQDRRHAVAGAAIESDVSLS